MTDKCKYHDQCRADNRLPVGQLCGFHHPRTWGWCQHFMEYEYQARLQKSKARMDAKAKIQDEAITTEMSRLVSRLADETVRA